MHKNFWRKVILGKYEEMEGGWCSIEGTEAYDSSL